MNDVNVNNTYDIKLAGEPSASIIEVAKPKYITLHPNSISHIKPKALVKEGTQVKIGTPLFIDKKNENILFLSPGAGKVAAIEYGDRRSLKSIRITLDKDEQKESFETCSPSDLTDKSAENIRELLLKGGVWSLFKALPFNTIPKPTDLPPTIFVCIDNDEPHTPASTIFLNDNIERFKFGINILKKLGRTKISISKDNTSIKKVLGNTITHSLQGHYPANMPGTFAYYGKQSIEENKGWVLSAQHVLFIAELFETGEYPTEQIITIGGPLIKNPTHAKIRIGTPINDLLINETITQKARFISGGVFTGLKREETDSLAQFDTALNVIQEGQESEMAHFMRIGANKHTYSRAYFGGLLKQIKWNMTSALNGSDRACIQCGYCAEVCPVETQPQLIMKAILAGDIESATEQGFLDCSDCGLCTYVCPSKIELDHIFKKEKNRIAKGLS